MREYKGKLFVPAYQNRGFCDYFICKDTHEILSEKRCGFPKLLKPVTNGNGYLMVGLWKNRRQYNVNIHRLLMETFVPNPNNYPHINHKDGNKLNNNFDNLEWCTAKHNALHAAAHGLTTNKHCYVPIHQYTLDGDFIQSFSSISEASVHTKIESSGIVENAKGRSKYAGHYIWSYVKTDKFDAERPKIIQHYILNGDRKFDKLNDLLKAGNISRTTFYTRVKEKGESFVFKGNVFKIVYV